MMALVLLIIRLLLIIGGVAIIYANEVATYLVGASNDEGRKRNVNTVLLWRAIQRAKELDPTIFTKSGIMVGLGETEGEVVAVMDYSRAARVDSGQSSGRYPR